MHSFIYPMHELSYYQLFSLIRLLAEGHSFDEIKWLTHDELKVLLEIYSSDQKYFDVANALSEWIIGGANDLYLKGAWYNSKNDTFNFEVDPSYEIFLNENHGLAIDKEDCEGYYHFDHSDRVWVKLEMLKEKE